MRLYGPGADGAIVAGGNTAAVLAALTDGADETENPLFVAAGLQGFNGATLDMIRSEGSDRDGIGVVTLGILETLGHEHIFNGTSWDRARSGGSASPLLGSRLVTPVLDPAVQSDVANDDSDKTFTVPANTHWHVLWIRVVLTTTATGGTRQLEVAARDASDVVLLTIRAGATQIESLGRGYNFYPGAPLDSAFIVDNINVPLPNDLWLPAGFDLRVRDNAAIAAAADDMTVQMMVDQRSV